MITGIAPDIERILEAGNQAPSGENCQPWHFVVRDENTIEIYLLPERDQSAYGWGRRASYLACGAVIENMIITASAEGYRADVEYFPLANPEHVATITLAKSVVVDALAPFIGKRVTNRKPYRKDPLTRAQSDALAEAAATTGYGTLALAEDADDVARLGRVGSTNEEIMLANRSLHRFFFNHVNWTKEEDERNKIGFFIKTLELPPPAQALFRILRRWPVMRMFNMIGFNEIVAKQNAAVNVAASAMGTLMIDGVEPIDFVKIGRSVERLWLTATSLGLSLQPLTGVLFFKLRIIDGGEKNVFSPRERARILESYRVAESIFAAEGRHIAFMFRIGHGDAPSARAVRFPLTNAVTVVL